MIPGVYIGYSAYGPGGSYLEFKRQPDLSWKIEGKCRWEEEIPELLETAVSVVGNPIELRSIPKTEAKP